MIFDIRLLLGAADYPCVQFFCSAAQEICGRATAGPVLQIGAYITDGVDLYEVIALQRGSGVMGIRTMRILVENCRFRGLEFLPEKIEDAFNVVRHPPCPSVPDLVAQISWEPALAGAGSAPSD